MGDAGKKLAAMIAPGETVSGDPLGHQLLRMFGGSADEQYAGDATTEQQAPKIRGGDKYRIELESKLRTARKAIEDASGDEDELAKRRAADAIQRELDIYERGFRAGFSTKP